MCWYCGTCSGFGGPGSCCGSDEDMADLPLLCDESEDEGVDLDVIVLGVLHGLPLHLQCFSRYVNTLFPTPSANMSQVC